MQAANSQKPTAKSQQQTANGQIEVSDLIGQPYTLDHDCNWLAAECARRLGLTYPAVDTPADPDQWPDLFKRIIAENYEPVGMPVVGSLVTFKIPQCDCKEHWHCGTVLKQGWMLTTTQGSGVHWARLDRRIWRICVRGYYLPKATVKP